MAVPVRFVPFLVALLLVALLAACGKRSPATGLRALVLEVSVLPAAAGNPYPDCLMAVDLQLLDPPAGMETRVSALFLGFTKRVNTAARGLQAGMQLDVQLRDRADDVAPFREMQVADTLKAIGLPPYRVMEWALAADKASFPLLAPLGDSPVGQLRAPALPLLSAAQLQRVVADRLLRDQLEPAPLPVGSTTLPYVWNPDGRWESAVRDSLRELQISFRALGTDLIVLPFPPRPLVESLRESARSTPVFYDRMMRDFMAHELEVIDLLPALLVGEGAYYYEDTADIHPADAGLQLAAREIAARIAEYTEGEPYELQRSPVAFRHDRYPLPDREYMDTEATRVLWQGQGLVFPELGPLLLFGDSFVKVPNGYGVDSANIAAQVAYELGHLPSYFTRPGDAHRIGRHLAQQQPSFLAGRKVAVFFFNGENVFRARGPWEAIDVLSQRVAANDKFSRFARAARIGKWSMDHGFAGWSLTAEEPDAPGPFPMTGTIVTGPHTWRLASAHEFPAGSYFLYLSAKGEDFGTMVANPDSDPQQIDIQRNQLFHLEHIRLKEGGPIVVQIPPQPGWLRIESMEIRQPRP